MIDQEVAEPPPVEGAEAAGVEAEVEEDAVEDVPEESFFVSVPGDDDGDDDDPASELVEVARESLR